MESRRPAQSVQKSPNFNDRDLGIRPQFIGISILAEFKSSRQCRIRAGSTPFWDRMVATRAAEIRGHFDASHASRNSSDLNYSALPSRSCSRLIDAAASSRDYFGINSNRRRAGLKIHNFKATPIAHVFPRHHEHPVPPIVNCFRITWRRCHVRLDHLEDE